MTFALRTEFWAEWGRLGGDPTGASTFDGVCVGVRSPCGVGGEAARMCFSRV